MKLLKSTGFLLFAYWVLLPSQDVIAQQPQPSQHFLAAPHRQAGLPEPASIWARHWGLRWDKGYLITYDELPGSPEKPAVVLYDRNGQVAREAIVWFKDARTVSISDAAVSKAGELVVSGGTENEAGVIANFIASIGSNGHVSHVVRTTPFLPFDVCDPGDGTVWSYGIDRDSQGRGVKESLRLRHYSFAKGQLAAMLDSTTLNSPSWSLTHGGYPGAISFRCTSTKVALLNVVSSEYVEVDIPTNMLRIRKLNPLPSRKEMRVTGFALTESGDVFVSLHDRTTQPPRSGIFKLTFDGANVGSWIPVENTVGPYLRGGPVERLLGADGDDLVYTRDLGGIVFWSKHENRIPQ
jgi:hypothetical protein